MAKRQRLGEHANAPVSVQRFTLTDAVQTVNLPGRDGALPLAVWLPRQHSKHRGICPRIKAFVKITSLKAPWLLFGVFVFQPVGVIVAVAFTNTYNYRDLIRHPSDTCMPKVRSDDNLLPRLSTHYLFYASELFCNWRPRWFKIQMVAIGNRALCAKGKTLKGVLFLSIFSSVYVKLCCHIQQSWKLSGRKQAAHTDAPVWL